MPLLFSSVLLWLLFEVTLVWCSWKHDAIHLQTMWQRILVTKGLDSPQACPLWEKIYVPCVWKTIHPKVHKQNSFKEHTQLYTVQYVFTCISTRNWIWPACSLLSVAQPKLIYCSLSVNIFIERHVFIIHLSFRISLDHYVSVLISGKVFKKSQVDPNCVSSTQEQYSFPGVKRPGIVRSDTLARFGCHFCPEHFTNRPDLTKHVQLEHQDTPFSCHVCGKCYSTLTGLKHHMEKHEGVVFTCPICDAKFTRKGSVKNHLKSLHKSSQCSTCNGIFYIGPEYTQHILNCK